MGRTRYCNELENSKNGFMPTHVPIFDDLIDSIL